MKKYFCVLFLIICFSGCKTELQDSDYNLANNISQEIVSYFDNKNIDGIKSLLCQNVLNTVDVDEQINQVFDVYCGNSLDYTVELGAATESIDEGITTERYISAYVTVDTDAEKQYTIYFAYYPIIEKDDMIGIYRITLYTDLNTEYIIGKHITVDDLK